MYVPGPSIRRSIGGGLNRHPPRDYLTWYMPPDANAAVDAVYRSDWGRIVATLIRLVRDFDVAEEAAQEAFAAAVGQWRGPRGPPAPRPRPRPAPRPQENRAPPAADPRADHADVRPHPRRAPHGRAVA